MMDSCVIFKNYFGQSAIFFVNALLRNCAGQHFTTPRSKCAAIWANEMQERTTVEAKIDAAAHAVLASLPATRFGGRRCGISGLRAQAGLGLSVWRRVACTYHAVGAALARVFIDCAL